MANLTNRRSGPELDAWLLTLLLFLVAAISHLSECCLLTALAADWNGAGHRRKLRRKQPHGGCARELLVIELWVPHHQEGGRGPFVMITILWCRARVLLVLLSLWYLASQHAVSTSCMKEHLGERGSSCPWGVGADPGDICHLSTVLLMYIAL